MRRTKLGLLVTEWKVLLTALCGFVGIIALTGSTAAGCAPQGTPTPDVTGTSVIEFGTGSPEPCLTSPSPNVVQLGC